MCGLRFKKLRVPNLWNQGRNPLIDRREVPAHLPLSGNHEDKASLLIGDNSDVADDPGIAVFSNESDQGVPHLHPLVIKVEVLFAPLNLFPVQPVGVCDFRSAEGGVLDLNEVPLFRRSLPQVQGNEETVPSPDQLGDRKVEPGLPGEKSDGRVHFGNGALLLRDEAGVIPDEPPDIGEGLINRLDHVREIVEGGEEKPMVHALPPEKAVG